MAVAILIDVGSTWTKGVAVALPGGQLIARDAHPTTLAVGIMAGARAVIDALTHAAGGDVAFRAATSSAAGGLRVAAIGLVPDLTGIAARQASLGAGARVVCTASYRLAVDDLAAIAQARPDIVLLSGGTDGGNSEVVLENARLLAGAGIAASIVLACNKSARDEAAAILELGGLQVRRADNVLPQIDKLSVDSAQRAIRELFLERIVIARGIEELRAWTSGRLRPTPRAVLDATVFLAEGPPNLGSVVVADIGGATTDIHSVGGEEPGPGVVMRGLREPRIKRTVEGDLGLRVSASAAADALGPDRLAARLGWTAAALRSEAGRRVAVPDVIEPGDRFDRVVASAVVGEALSRHSGRLEPVPLRRGQWIQTGKDLRRATTLVGAGGIFAARSDAKEILYEAVACAAESGRLVPQSPELLVDRCYVLFAVGLLCAEHPKAAASLARLSLSMQG